MTDQDTQNRRNGLAAKLAEVTDVIKQPDKSGQHNYPDFEYSTRDDLFNVLRGELSSRGVAMMVSTRKVASEPAEETNKGKPQQKITVRVKIHLIDSDTGEELECEWDGESVTHDDKGIQQAATQAIRFWILNSFQLTDESIEQQYGRGRDDHENVHHEPAQSSEQATDERSEIADAIWEMCVEAGCSDDQANALMDYIAQANEVHEVDEVPAPRLRKWQSKLGTYSDEELIEKVSKRTGIGQAA